MESNHTKRILGLDLGVTSIGWAMIEENKSENVPVSKILDMGSRIIPLSSEENDEFTRGNAQSNNATRRMKRSARRNLQRYRLRKHLLISVLKEHRLMPEDNLFKLDAVSLYELRDRAIREKISLQEIGRIFFHLNQKRGYKSNRKANNEEETSINPNSLKQVSEEEETINEKKPKRSGYLELIAERENLIARENLTIGQYFYTMLKADSHFRVKENIFLRNSYMNEFDRIWEKQHSFYPEILTNSLFEDIRNRIIFYHRPLKSQKALVGNCRFEPKNKVAPKSSPLFQIFKIWQELNNIEIISFKGIKGVEEDARFDKQGKRFLELDEKKALFEILNASERLSKKKLLQVLGLKSGYDNYSINIQKDIEGNKTFSLLRKSFYKLEIDRPELFKFLIESEDFGNQIVNKETGEVYFRRRIVKRFEQEPLFQLWHLIYSVEETEELISALVKKFEFTPVQARELSKIDFHKSGYGSLSTKAIRNILPFLEQGAKYHIACEYAGYRHSDFLTKEENELRNLIDKLDLIKKGSLRNPVVEKIINQTINLVNTIIEDPDLGRPDEIRVELARELKQNAEQRKRTYKNISELDKQHKFIEEKLRQEFNFRRVSRNDIERYKLWKEFGEISPYEPGKVIGLSELFDGRSYDIEHIIPKSRMFDDSFANKTICHRRFNSGQFGKNQMTAYDYMKSRSKDEFESYVEFVSKYFREGKISKAKFNRLMMPENEIPADFINRQLNETRYISREIKNTLTQICRNVYSTSGQVTSELRYLWGYDDITMKLNMDRYEQADLTYSFKDSNGQVFNRIKYWTKRDDHRHHAIDALVVAATSQSIIQRINNLNQIYVAKNSQKGDEDLRKKLENTGLDAFIKELRPFSPEEVKKSAAKILVSFKPGKRVAIVNKNTYKHKKGSKTLQSSLTPRGYLHKETVYGKIRRYELVTINTRFNRFDDIVEIAAKDFLNKHNESFNRDSRKAFVASQISKLKEYIEESPVTGVLIKDGVLVVSCFKNEFVVRYPLNALKARDVDEVVDERVKAILMKRVAEMGEKDAFKDLMNNPVWFNEEKGIQIKSARLFTGLGDLVPLHRTLGGTTYPASSPVPGGKDVDFVSTRNNHHIAIYMDKEGMLRENTVTFWDALNRKRFGIPVVIKNTKSVWDYLFEKKDLENEIPSEVIENLPADGWEYVTSMQQNEMFVFEIDRETLQNAINQNEYDLISKHLYRVQKITSGDYYFRHHLETKVDDKYGEKKDENLSRELGKVKRITSLVKMTGIKIRVNSLGKIMQIE